MTWELVLQICLLGVVAMVLGVITWATISAEIDRHTARKEKLIRAEAEHLREARLYAKEAKPGEWQEPLTGPGKGEA